ncbi:MAG: hypothetical protein C0P68_010170 [Bacillota bacterium]
MSLDAFLSRYLELTEAITEAIEREDWDEVNRWLDERTAWIDQEGARIAPLAKQPLTAAQQALLAQIREKDAANYARLQEQQKAIQNQIRQSQMTRQAVRGYMEEGLVRDELHSTLFNRGV